LLQYAADVGQPDACVDLLTCEPRLYETCLSWACGVLQQTSEEVRRILNASARRRICETVKCVVCIVCVVCLVCRVYRVSCVSYVTCVVCVCVCRVYVCVLASPDDQGSEGALGVFPEVTEKCRSCRRGHRSVQCMKASTYTHTHTQTQTDTDIRLMPLPRSTLHAQVCVACAPLRRGPRPARRRLHACRHSALQCRPRRVVRHRLVASTLI